MQASNASKARPQATTEHNCVAACRNGSTGIVAPHMKQQATRHASWSDNQTTVSSEGTQARQGKASARHNTKLAGGCNSERPARKTPAGGCISERPARYTHTDHPGSLLAAVSASAQPGTHTHMQMDHSRIRLCCSCHPACSVSCPVSSARLGFIWVQR